MKKYKIRLKESQPKLTPEETEQFSWAVGICRKECKDPYARTYLEAIPQSIEEYGSNGLSVQLLYLLNNLSTWRGENARKAKEIFKMVSKKTKGK